MCWPTGWAAFPTGRRRPARPTSSSSIATVRRGGKCRNFRSPPTVRGSSAKPWQWSSPRLRIVRGTVSNGWRSRTRLCPRSRRPKRRRWRMRRSSGKAWNRMSASTPMSAISRQPNARSRRRTTSFACKPGSGGSPVCRWSRARPSGSTIRRANATPFMRGAAASFDRSASSPRYWGWPRTGCG